MSTILFHTCCKGCLSQRLYGEDRCAGCCYFEYEEDYKKRKLPSLFIDQEMIDQQEVERARERIKRRMSPEVRSGEGVPGVGGE